MMTAFFASRTVHAVTGPEVNQIQKERRILPSTGNTLHFQNTHTIISLQIFYCSTQLLL
jgi:hypothetical protein